jgi:hypothetical protein
VIDPYRNAREGDQIIIAGGGPSIGYVVENGVVKKYYVWGGRDEREIITDILAIREHPNRSAKVKRFSTEADVPDDWLIIWTEIDYEGDESESESESENDQ